MKLPSFFYRLIGYQKPFEIISKPTNRVLVEKDLAAVVCYFNPTQSKRRKINFDKFFREYQAQYSRVPLLVIELAFGEEAFELSEVSGVWQIRTDDILWQKERLLNLGIERLLSEGYRNVAWLDADVLFTDPQWPEKAVDILDTVPLCQLFSHSVREEEMHKPYSARRGVVYDFKRAHKARLMGLSCGYAWAANASLLKTCLLYDAAIIGGGDAAIWLAAIRAPTSRAWKRQMSRIKSFQSYGPYLREHYLEWAKRFGDQVQRQVGYVDQKIIALYHGKIRNRAYTTRYLSIPEFSPQRDLVRDEVGCWSWRKAASENLQEKVRVYFFLRQDDEPLRFIRAEKTSELPDDFRPIKLCIQIPCYNEEQTLLQTLHSLPTQIEGVREIEIVVVDDGSSDRTLLVAGLGKANHVVQSKSHRGLANAFRLGIQKCLSLDADIIVNLDADNQYDSKCIAQLIRPILLGRADIVLGARTFHHIPEFSKIKVAFQRLGSFAISKICRVKIADAATGFRAFSRKSAIKINVFTKYTYTLETLIQAAQNGEKIISIPIQTNPATRPSRLFSHPLIYVLRSVGAIVRLVLLYNPLRVMTSAAMLCILGALVVFSFDLFLFYFLLLVAIILFLTGLVLDQIAVNRRLLEQTQHRLGDPHD
jgi:glycosyltransferase involved in cell wall biosynthesis